MSKRIEELAEEALIYATTNGYSDDTYRPTGYTASVSKAFADKFVELILKDCATVLVDSYPPDDCIPVEEAVACINGHFGIE